MKSNRGIGRISLPVVFSLVVLVFYSQAFAQGGTWTTKAPMPTARWSLGAGAVNGIIYALGGVPVLSTCSFLANNEAYDTTSNTWSTKASMPTARDGFGVGVVNGTVYAVGGGVGCGVFIATLEAYDPVSNSWTTKAPMPTVRYIPGVGEVNGILYVVGGTQVGPVVLTTVEAYDPATNSWTTKAPMPTPRGGLVAGVVNGILYAVGGAGSPTFFTVEAYDPTTNSWTTAASMPTGRAHPAGAVVNGTLYVVGGETISGVLATNEAFSPLTYSCTDFAPPFDVPIALHKDRAIPVQMQLSSEGVQITDLNIAGAAPVVNVSFSAGGGPAVDVTSELLPLGQSDTGNQFRFDVTSGQWIYNLGTKPFTASGTYTVTAKSGDTSYVISPTCTGQFVRD